METLFDWLDLNLITAFPNSTNYFQQLILSSYLIIAKLIKFWSYLFAERLLGPLMSKKRILSRTPNASRSGPTAQTAAAALLSRQSDFELIGLK